VFETFLTAFLDIIEILRYSAVCSKLRTSFLSIAVYTTKTKN